jgi:hypothetical protein
MTPFSKIESKQRVLHKMRVAAMGMVSPYILDSLDVDIVEDMLSRNLCYRVTAFVLAEDFGTKQYKVTFTEPSSWWQHFKRDVLRLHCKTKLTTKTVIGHGYRGYPHAPIALPADKMGDSVIFETFEMKP